MDWILYEQPELLPLRGNTLYFDAPYALIPAYRLHSGQLVLIDSGADPYPALLEWLDREGLQVRAVLSTHLHIDHIGNNEELVKHHGTEIFAHPAEFPDFHRRYGEPFPVTAVEGGAVTLEGIRFQALETPGHCPGHLAWITPEGVCCLGDAIMSREELQRAKIPYMEDVDRSIISMEALRETDYPVYLMAHKGIIAREELAALVEENIQKELELYDLLRSQLQTPADMETAVSAFIRAAGVRSEKMVEESFVRHTARVRILALVNAGEFVLEGDVVRPI